MYTCSASVNCFAVSGTNIYVGTNGILMSTNNGTTWNWMNNGITNKYIEALAINGQNIFAGYLNSPGSGGGVLLSTNSGASWTTVNNGFPTNDFVNALALLNTKLFAGTDQGVVLSTNNGSNWIVLNNELSNIGIYSLAVSGTNIFAGTNHGVFLSTNYGTNWISTGLGGQYINDIISMGDTLFAMGTSGVFITTNNGISWNPAGLMTHTLYSFAIFGTNLFAGTDGIFLTTNNGTTWLNKNQGLNIIPVFVKLYISGNYIFAGIWNNYSVSTIWRRSLSEIIDVKNISSTVPDKYSLSQNYPNPYNPSTKIRFSIPPPDKSGSRTKSDFEGGQGGMIVLKVYDILGNEIATLVNEYLKPGTYEVKFDGSQLVSGMYFYTLTAGDFKETKKLILIK